MFYSGLAVMVIGIGLLKPNVSAVVGSLYEGQTGARRDAGFSIFYMGINLGATFGPIIAGYVGEVWNWRAGFLCCGVATLIGALVFRANNKYLGQAGLAPENVPPQERRKTWMLIGIIAIAAVAGASALFFGDHLPTKTEMAVGLLVTMISIAVVFFVYVLFFAGLDSAARKRVGVIFIFFVCAALFWAGFEQQGTTFNTFAIEYTNRSMLGGWFPEGVHPASWYQSANPAFIIIFAPFFAWIWVALGARNLDPSAPFKMGLGLVLLGVGFLVMVLGRRTRGLQRRQGRADLAAARLHDPHLRRVVPVAGRTLERHQARTAEVRRPHDGHLVPRRGDRQHHRRPRRRPAVRDEGRPAAERVLDHDG